MLLFPGGAREVFKRKGEEYRLFWPESPDLLRLAAKLNATLLPFSGIGGDESMTLLLDSQVNHIFVYIYIIYISYIQFLYILTRHCFPSPALGATNP